MTLRIQSALLPTSAQLLRWLGLIGFSILLHGLGMLWLDGRLNSRGFGRTHGDDIARSNLQARLQAAKAEPAAPVPLPETAKADEKPPPARKKTTPRAPKPQHFAADTPASAEPPVEDSVAEVVAQPAPAPTTSAEPVATPIATTGSSAGLAPLKEQDSLPVYPVKPPPPARLSYKVLASYNGNPVYGTATFEWQHDGQQYQLHSETKVSLLFFSQTLATLDSKGSFDDAGLAPSLYQEKLKRGLSNTHFNHFRADAPEHPTNGNTVSFSASSATYARPAGAQDRLSILWQLAGIGRAKPELFTAGAEFSIFVAATRDADIWQVQVIAQEEIRVSGKNYQAWHIQRRPRAGSYDKTLDIWFAPQEDWFPVRVLQTETDGKTYDFMLDEIERKPLVLAPPPTTPTPTPIPVPPTNSPAPKP